MGKSRVKQASSGTGIPYRFLTALTVTTLVAVALVSPNILARHSIRSTPQPAWDRITPPAPTVAFTPLQVLPPQLEETRRPVYPYSIVPGGIENSGELQTAIQGDPVVAAHYSDFEISRARTMRLDQARPVYVSYRLGDKVFWSTKKLILASGETLITDGTHQARTRCGNRVSETPQLPVSKEQPSLKALEIPLDPALLSELESPPILPMAPPTTSIAFPEGAGGPPGGGWFFLPVVPIFPGGGGSSATTPPVVPAVVPPIPPPTATPEPGTLLLVVSGVAGGWAARKKFLENSRL
jgi:PEP-CTERM motif